MDCLEKRENSDFYFTAHELRDGTMHFEVRLTPSVQRYVVLLDDLRGKLLTSLQKCGTTQAFSTSHHPHPPHTFPLVRQKNERAQTVGGMTWTLVYTC